MDQNPSPAAFERVRLERLLGVAPRARFKRLLAPAIAVVAAVVLLAAWLIFGGAAEAPRYATVDIERGDLRVTVSATGNLQPTNKIDVGSELSGTVAEVYVDNNDNVVKGQVLARLDTSRLTDAVNESDAAPASAKAGVAQADATLGESTTTLTRLENLRRLSNGQLPAVADIDTARAVRARAAAGLLAAQAAVRRAEATLSSNQTQLSKAVIRAPVTGVVLSRAVGPGQTVAASFNAPVLFILAEDLTHMQLEVKIDEADVGQVKGGQSATFQVDAYPGRNFTAALKRLNLGPTTTTSASGAGQVVAYTAVLTAENPDLALRPGMTGTASILIAEKNNVLLAPNPALRFSPGNGARAAAGGVTRALIPRGPRIPGQTAAVTIGRGSRQTLYFLQKNGDLQAVPVQAGDSNGAQTEVEGESLSAGMKVVTGLFAAKAP